MKYNLHYRLFLSKIKYIRRYLLIIRHLNIPIYFQKEIRKSRTLIIPYILKIHNLQNLRTRIIIIKKRVGNIKYKITY